MNCVTLEAIYGQKLKMTGRREDVFSIAGKSFKKNKTSVGIFQT